MIDFLISSIHTAVRTPFFIFFTISLSFIVKIYLLKILIPQGLRSTTIYKPWFFLLGALTGSMFGDIAWIVKLIRDLGIGTISYATLVFFVRISWGFLILQYQALALFMESLTYKNFMLKPMHRILLFISIGFSLYFFFEAFFDSTLTDAASRTIAIDKQGNVSIPFEIQAMRYVSFYLLHLLVIPGLISTFWRLYTVPLPKILKNQLKIVLIYFICPYLLVEFLQAAQFVLPLFRSHLYPIVACSTMLIACATAYCIHKVIGLRFLNFESNVQTSYNFNFMNEFKNLLEQFSHTKSLQELNALTQIFFNDAFGIPARKTTLTILNQREIQPDYERSETGIESVVANVLHTNNDLCSFIKKRKILIYDELEFTNFYEEQEFRKTILTFMENINADVFLPIYDKNSLIGYIIVEQSTRKTAFYGNTEQDEMLIFVSYLSSIVNLLQHRNLKILLHKEKELKEELHRKYQEINQYKESIKSFLRDSPQKELGIVFYRNRRFIFGNKAAKNLIAINLNTQDGHPLTKAIKKLVSSVATYNAPQTSFGHDSQGKKIVLYAVPNLEQNTIILMVYHPEISDLITRKISLLKDPTTWDYLLYLETTQSGQLINQLIPGSGETLLNFKIDLLKMALSRKAILLEMAQEDLMPTVEIIHHISLREKLHVLTLKKAANSTDIAIQLFGMNQLFDAKGGPKPLLNTLNNIGTLFIKNIEYLDLETQKYLAEFLKYGIYKIFRSDEKVTSSVRIICSTQHDLRQLVEKGNFLPELFDELSQTSLIMPSLTTLPEQELNKLADGFTELAIKTKDLHDVLSLTDKEKSNLACNRPVSLHDLKNKTQEILIKKSHKSNIYHESQLDPTFELHDPELVSAAQLGKKALRDEEIMKMLWNKFQNQNKIAVFLGVNRSSINRRCKEFGLQ